ncbi:hypothetical protein MPSEU_000090700 [Mayamaea pseudoterrestris]|nr:hypothetical protein MPSEU_000090700 [Mayamaea pseudoterrestris]
MTKRSIFEDGDKADHRNLFGSPVKEITIHHKDMRNNNMSKKLRKAPNDLDEETMRIVLAYLKDNGPKSYLNDEEITAFMVRMNRAADRQTEQHFNLLGQSDESDTSLFNDLLTEEEEIAIGQSYMKDIVANLKKETDYELDPRTLGWIRRAAGLHRSKPESYLREGLNGIGKGDRAIKTRRTTQQQKNQRRDKGIHLLVEALDDVEDEIGKFEKVNVNIKRKRELSESSNPDEEVAKKPRPVTSNAMHTPAANKILIAKIPFRETLPNGLSFLKSKVIRIGRLVVNGSVHDGTMDMANGSMGGISLRDAGKQASKVPMKRVTAKDLCLKRHLRRRTRNLSISASAFDGSETKELYHSMVLAKIPPAIKAAGIEFRLPRWETINRTYSSALNPPRQRHSDKTYAALCMRLVRSLRKGPTRAFASREFFYSDIDREWFSRNEIREEVARLGLSPDVKLTTSEWRVIRRRVKKNIRRFSRRFVESQLEGLRKYRARVRLVQHNAMKLALASVDFDIPAPIPFGTTVSVYSAKHDIILRGTVLTHETRAFSYLVLYDRKEFGSEICADYDVASHGGPANLLSRSRRLGTPTMSFCGSVKGTINDALRLPPIERRIEMQESLVFDPYPSPTSGKKPNMDNTGLDTKVEAVRRVAETEAFVGLLAVIDAATRRKEALLAALEEANAVVANNDNVSVQFQYAREWLKLNLLQTDQVLNAAMPKLRLMYGTLYMPTPTERDQTSQDDRYSFVEKSFDTIAQCCRPGSDLGKDWNTILLSETANASKTMATTVIHRALADKRVALPPAEDLRSTEYLLGPVGSVLLAASYGHRFARTSKVADPVPLTSALETASKALVLSSDIPEVANADELYVDVQAGRDSAADDLKEALTLLQTEILLATAQKSLGQADQT